MRFDESVTRHSMNLPMPDDYQFNGLVTKRRFPHFKRTKWCLYSSDQETLYMAAEYKKGMNSHVTITIDATNMSQGTLAFVGTFDGENAISWHPRPDNERRVMLIAHKHEMIIPQTGVQFVLHPGKTVNTDSGSRIAIAALGNFEFRGLIGDNEVFHIKAVEEDEFLVNIRSPLSLFQGFVILLALVKI